MEFILRLTLLFQEIVFIYLFLTVFYTFILSLAGKYFYRKPVLNLEAPKTNIAIIIPAYKEDGIIFHTIEEHLSLDYPKENYRVFLAADSFQPETIARLKEYPITVLEVKFDISTVTKSVKQASYSINAEEFPVTLICDADNVLEKDFLKKINSLFYDGIQAVQARRFTKNLNTNMAVLDSLSEIINNHLFKKGSYSLGLSAALIGSGMAFKTDILQDCLRNNESIGGYDRELQLALSERFIRIHYLEDAICYDEKVSDIKSFGNQRRRWLSAQFLDLRDHFVQSFQMLFKKGGFKYFQMGFINNFFLPRVLNLGLLVIITLFSSLVYFFISNTLVLNPIYWLALLFVYILSLGLGVPSYFFNSKLFSAFLTLPKTFGVMFGLLFKLKGANKKFIHTTHHVLGVEDVLQAGPEKTQE